jgi:hypothetical protein
MYRSKYSVYDTHIYDPHLTSKAASQSKPNTQHFAPPRLCPTQYHLDWHRHERCTYDAQRVREPYRPNLELALLLCALYYRRVGV